MYPGRYKRLGETHCFHLFEKLATLHVVTSEKTVVSVLTDVISYNCIVLAESVLTLAVLL